MASLCFFLSITIWVTPGNQLAKRQLRGFSVLLQDFQGPQRVSPFSCSPIPQMLRIGAVLSSPRRSKPVQCPRPRLRYGHPLQCLRPTRSPCDRR